MTSEQPTHLARNTPELPVDVVHGIFTFFARPLSTRKLSYFPWFLGHICSTWRSTFMSMTTEFWSSISITFDWVGNERRKNIVQFFVERDPAAPFSLKVDLPPAISSAREKDHIRHALDMLINASMRWENLSFEGGTIQHILPLIRIKHHLPLLRRLWLAPQCPEESDLEPLFDVFQDAPSLTVVNVDKLTGWKFDLVNLRAITIDWLGSGAPNFITVLPHMTKLERLVIGDPGDTISFPSSILLPNLVKLDCKPRWFDSLTVPALQDLSIDNDGLEGLSAVDTVRSFLCRSSCNMQISSLTIRNAEAITAIETIRLAPRIVHLQLVFVGNVGNVFEELTVSTNPVQEQLARHMRSLSIYDDIGDPYDDLLFDLVSSRTVNSVADDRLQKLFESRRRYGVSIIAMPRLIALCKERRVQYNDTE